jgi:hypothetical protein
MSKPVLLIRAHGNDEDSAELAKFGIVALIDPYLQLTVAEDTGPAFALLDLIESSLEPVWVIATSVNAIEYWAKLVGQERLRRYFSSRLNLNFAAVGKKTADALSKYGAKRVLVPQEANAATLAKELISRARINPGRQLGDAESSNGPRGFQMASKFCNGLPDTDSSTRAEVGSTSTRSRTQRDSPSVPQRGGSPYSFCSFAANSASLCRCNHSASRPGTRFEGCGNFGRALAC